MCRTPDWYVALLGMMCLRCHHQTHSWVAGTGCGTGLSSASSVCTILHFEALCMSAAAAYQGMGPGRGASLLGVTVLTTAEWPSDA